MKELIQKIEQWANDRNIIKGSKPIDQAMKLFSEFGELADNVGKGRDCRDDIGDVFVVLTIIAAQLDCSTEENFNVSLWHEKEDLSIKDYVLLLSDKLTEFCFDARDGNVDNNVFDAAVSILKTIALKLNTTLEECAQIAYNDIKDRKGLMHGGVFIKESDPAYASIIKSIESNCE